MAFSLSRWLERQADNRQEFVPVVTQPGDDVGDVTLEIRGRFREAFCLFRVLECAIQCVSHFITTWFGLSQFVLSVFERIIYLL